MPGFIDRFRKNRRNQRERAANAQAAIGAVEAMAERVGIARSISDMGGTSDHLPELVQQAISDVTMLAKPRPATSDDVREL